MDKKATENGTGLEVPSTSSAMSKTTTISTIAVQSGRTRIVIALLHCGDWIQLKILEITPELTQLGDTLEEAVALQQAHDEVLRQLKNKQSPVEELLRQADQLIATQKPRAEVYAAMAESLGRAWKDINSLLELRKEILDLNVQYHTQANEFFCRMGELEASCTDTVVPIEIDAVKSFLNMIHELRRVLLEALKNALQVGNTLLAKLKELGAEGTLDSRPDRIRTSVNRAISQVQGWMDQLHLKRQVLEATFNRRKTQLEQCLALAMLAADLHELEDIVNERRNLLANTDQLGNSISSAELLLHEHMKLLPEARQLQERALKITKATEQLLASGCFAGEQATEQSYAILSSTSDYLADLQNRENLLERIIAFFKQTQSVFNQLDDMEMQLTTNALPSTSPQLIQLHANSAKAIEAITAAPIAEGYGILDMLRGRAGTEGVKQTVEELENRKIALDRLCIAHKEENIRINKALNNFLEKHNDIYSWLVSVAEAFLQEHRDMGNDLNRAKNFLELHNQLLNDLQTKGNEINALLLTLPPILEFLQDNQRQDVDSKVEELHERWMKLKTVLENRLDLSRIYVKFHMEADIVNQEMNNLEQELQSNRNNASDQLLKYLEEKWESLVPLYQSAKNTGLTFIDQSNKISEPYLDTKRACLCVESVLERLSGRQLQVTKNWQTFHTEIIEKREVLVRLEETMAECTKTINWVTKLDDQLYPVITTDATNPKEIAAFLTNKLETVLPDIKKAQSEVNQRIKNAEALIAKAQATDEKTLQIKSKLAELNKKLADITNDYHTLLQELINFFNNLFEIDNTASKLSTQPGREPEDLFAIDSLIREHDISRQTLTELLKHAQSNCDRLVQRIRRQEPATSAQHDISKLQHSLELLRGNWENQWLQRRDGLQAQKQLIQFNIDLRQINETIDDLSQQLEDVKGRYGESSAAALATSNAFVHFEKTVGMLEDRIKLFVQTGEKLLADSHAQSPHIQRNISQLQDRWNNFKKQVQDTRNLINLSLQFFDLVEQANGWFKEGNSFLVNIARRSQAVKTPQEAQVLLNEIQMFIIPGEQKQNERIKKIVELANKIYGPSHSSQINNVIQENQGLFESFNSIQQEINILAHNLKVAEEQKLREIEEAKIRAAQEEEKRKRAEEEKRRVAEEARRRAEAEAEAAQRAAEEEARRFAAEEARRRAEAEAEAARRAAEEEAKRLAAEEARRKAEAEAEAARRAAEEEARRLAAEEARRKALAEAAQRAAEEEARRLAAEEARRKAEAEAVRKAAEEETIRLAAEEARRKAEAEAAQRAAEEAKRKAEEEMRLASQNVHVKEIIHQIQMEKSSTPVHIEEIDAPVFISPLSNAVIQEGSRFTFMCQVTGNPVPVVTWFKDGISIQNNPDYQTTFDLGLCTLTIEETFAEDSAKYTCKAINAAGTAETSATLSVKEIEEQMSPPIFVKLLEPGHAREGSTFHFHCKVEGNPLPTVQWFKNNECIDNLSQYVITYNNGDAVLTFEKIYLEDKAEYTCKASNEMGTAQSTASLGVTPLEPMEAPKFILPLSNVMARAGQKIKLECEVSGLPPPILTWTHNGKAVKETRELKLQYEGNKATLVVYEAFPKDAGTYVISAKNTAGEASSACGVSVKGRLPTETSDSELASDMEPVKPSIQLPLTNVTIPEGNRVRLDCVIVGQPEPEVIWYHDDRPVKESTDFQLLFQGDRCSLIIQEAFAEDAGQYKVVALNSAGEASSRCTLTVTPLEDKTMDHHPESAGTPPKFIKLLADVLVSEGENVAFEGNVIGEPKPEIKWLLNNQELNLNDHIKVSQSDDGNIKLEIESVRPEDKGVYTVKASNALGDAKCFAQLIVKSLKPSETVKHEEVKSAPVFREMFHDRVAFESTSTKFECIVVGKPTPKIKWLFNGDPISGKKFLVSTSGDRQVLTIPEIAKDLEGTITCVAENDVGKASCAATLSVQSSAAITLPEIGKELHQHVESSYFVNKEMHMQSSTSQSSKIITSTTGQAEPQVQVHSYTAQDQKSFKQINQQAPQISESHKVEEFHQIGQQTPVVHQKFVSNISTGTAEQTETKAIETIVHKPMLKLRPPKFVTPVIGKIVDQNVNVILEGILDGQPTPQVSWTKNGQELKSTEEINVTYEHNRAVVTISNVTIEDAGKYTCTAVNEAGKAVSTADLVVRKTVFPPVFGKRLQAQVIKKGDRIIMEVEITGTPEPTVTWFKDGIPIAEALKDNHRIRSMGNSYTVTIEKADLNLTGRYMVRAVNSGGEAQSIADIAVFEPTPDTMVEVVKTVVFEDVRKHETLTSGADQVSSSIQTHALPPSPLPIITAPTPTVQSSFQSDSQFSTTKSEFHSMSEQKISQESKTVKLEHTMPDIPMIQPRPIELIKQTDYEICQPAGYNEEKQIQHEETGIETSSISKQSSLQYFVKKIKQGEEPQPIKEITIPEQIKPEIYQKFDVTQKSDFKETSIPIKIEAEPSLQHYQAFSQQDIILQPEPPAEICYTQPTVSKIQEKVHVIEQTPHGYEQKQSFSQKMEQSYQTSSSSFSKHVETSSQPPVKIERPASTIPPPTFEKFQQIPRPLSAMSGAVEPSPQAIQMEKAWAHKFSETEVEKSWPPLQQEETKIIPTWSATSTLEKKWTPEVKQTKSEQFTKETKQITQSIPIQHTWKETKTVIEVPPVVTHYIGKVTDVQHSSFMQTKSEFESSSHKQEIIEERNVKPSEIIKSWPPAQIIKPIPPIESLPIRPVSVQDITDEIYLEPGSPPEIGYAHPPPRERKQSYVEMIEQDLEKSLEKVPAKVPPGGVRTIPPPPLPPKKELPVAPPIPAKPTKPVAFTPKPIPVVESRPFEKFPELEPFPFKVGPEKPKPPRVGPPPTPSKFIKGRFTDSDYESDFESVRIPPKWKPCSSDTEEPMYRKVRAPKGAPATRSRSVEPEPLPPSKFEQPPHFQGVPRPAIDLAAEKRKIQSIQQEKKQTKHYTKTHEVKKQYVAQPPPPKPQPEVILKPGSPPVFVEAPKPKPESPKFRYKKSFDGYMADTDEPFMQQSKSIKTEYREEKSEYKHISHQSEKIVESSHQNIITPKPQPVHKTPQHKRYVASVSSVKKELVPTPIITSVTSQHVVEEQKQHTTLEPFPFKAEPPRGKKARQPPPPSPSKFVKGEFRESDYESEYESRIRPLWHPAESDGEPSYKPVRPLLTPSGRQSQQSGRTPTPPTEFDRPPHIDGPPRPKFEPIEKFKPSVKLDELAKPTPQPMFKPKPVSAATYAETIIATPARPQQTYIIQPGSPPEMGFAPGPQKTQYYRSTTSAPYHNAIQTETSNVMHFNESSENCHRTMKVQQTTKVIKFGEQSRREEQAKLEPFPYRPAPEEPRIKVAPPPTPRKFIPGEYRESDYESEVETARIKPKWAPSGSDSEGVHFRPVQAPRGGRSSSAPAPKERVVTPMEFDQPPLMPTVISTDRTDSEMTRREMSSYNKYTERSGGKMMTRSHSYEPPARPAILPGTPPEYGYVADARTTATNIATKHMDNMTKAFRTTTQKFAKDIMSDVNRKQQTKPTIKVDGDGDAQVYREESRAAQYGTKHVDPDTGLIYFKYDFGYEFGIIFPGASKAGEIPMPKKTVIEPPKRAFDIELPVHHETTKTKGQQNGARSKKPFQKNVKWEPTSESEMSEYEGEHKKRNCNLQGSRWDQSSCSPVSLSPSLPSTSPAFNNTLAGSGRNRAETPPSCPSTPGSVYSKQNQAQARAPIFITPLRDIAVVSGQAAKFECIVQSEPSPNILWSKNGRIIENSNDYQIYYRNGVCRLTISQAYPEDAGTYTCTAANPVGTVNTTAVLQVPGERRSSYI